MAGSPSVGCVEQAYSNSPSSFNRLSRRAPCCVDCGSTAPGFSPAAASNHLIRHLPLGRTSTDQVFRRLPQCAAPACNGDLQAGAARSGGASVAAMTSLREPPTVHSHTDPGREKTRTGRYRPLFSAEIDSKTSGSASVSIRELLRKHCTHLHRISGSSRTAPLSGAGLQRGFLCSRFDPGLICQFDLLAEHPFAEPVQPVLVAIANIGRPGEDVELLRKHDQRRGHV